MHDKSVYFLHQTAREFLLPIAVCLSGPTITRTWAHTLDIYQTHAVLAESYTVYLTLRTEKDGVTEMLDYSARHWGSHFREANIENTAVLSLALKICNPTSNHYAAWAKIYRRAHYSFPQNATNLILASYFGHKGVVRVLLDTGKVDVDAKDEDGQTPLLFVAARGYETMVRMLLDTGKVGVDAEDKHGRTPLSLTAEKGHENVVRRLHEFIHNRSAHDPIPTAVSSLLRNSE